MMCAADNAAAAMSGITVAGPTLELAELVLVACVVIGDVVVAVGLVRVAFVVVGAVVVAVGLVLVAFVVIGASVVVAVGTGSVGGGGWSLRFLAGGGDGSSSCALCGSGGPSSVTSEVSGAIALCGSGGPSISKRRSLWLQVPTMWEISQNISRYGSSVYSYTSEISHKACSAMSSASSKIDSESAMVSQVANLTVKSLRKPIHFVHDQGSPKLDNSNLPEAREARNYSSLQGAKELPESSQGGLGTVFLSAHHHWVLGQG
jgi:hypothetical protein